VCYIIVIINRIYKGGVEMEESDFIFYGELDLSQTASKVSWEFLKLCQGETKKPATEVAKIALKLCLAVNGIKDLYAGKYKYIEEVPAINSIPTATRRMFLAENRKKDTNITKYKAIASYACKLKSVLESIASGEQRPTADHLEHLREHFASLSLILSEVDL
jgi:hypothetical protein